jgi:hypothetical protein
MSHLELVAVRIPQGELILVEIVVWVDRDIRHLIDDAAVRQHLGPALGHLVRIGLVAAGRDGHPPHVGRVVDVDDRDGAPPLLPELSGRHEGEPPGLVVVHVPRQPGGYHLGEGLDDGLPPVGVTVTRAAGSPVASSPMYPMRKVGPNPVK